MSYTTLNWLVWAFLALLSFPFFYGGLKWRQKYAAGILLGGLVATLLLLILSFYVLGYLGFLLLPFSVMAIFGGLVGLIVKSVRLRLEKRDLKLKP
jgi:hypothetical protein